jgi:hypothetical protein
MTTGGNKRIITHTYYLPIGDQCTRTALSRNTQGEKNMSTDTRHTERVKSNLAGLFASAIDYINRGIRDAESIKQLLRAMQLFKYGKLKGVISSDEVPATETLRELVRNRIQKAGPLEQDLVYSQILSGLRPRAKQKLLAEFPSLPDLLSAPANRIRHRDYESSLPTLEINLASFGLSFQMSQVQIKAVFPFADFMSVNKNIYVLKEGTGFMLYVPGLSNQQVSYVCFGRSFAEALGILIFEERNRFLPDTSFAGVIRRDNGRGDWEEWDQFPKHYPTTPWQDHTVSFWDTIYREPIRSRRGWAWSESEIVDFGKGPWNFNKGGNI